MMAALKSLSNNSTSLSHPCWHLLIVIVQSIWDHPSSWYDESLSIETWTFWVLWDSGSYLNVLFKLDFMTLLKEERVLPHDCQVSVKSRSPSWPPLTLKGWGSPHCWSGWDRNVKFQLPTRTPVLPWEGYECLISAPHLTSLTSQVGRVASVTLSGGQSLLWHHPSRERVATSWQLGGVGSPGSFQTPPALRSRGLPHHPAGMKVLTPCSGHPQALALPEGSWGTSLPPGESGSWDYWVGLCRHVWVAYSD